MLVETELTATQGQQAQTIQNPLQVVHGLLGLQLLSLVPAVRKDLALGSSIWLEDPDFRAIGNDNLNVNSQSKSFPTFPVSPHEFSALTGASFPAQLITWILEKEGVRITTFTPTAQTWEVVFCFRTHDEAMPVDGAHRVGRVARIQGPGEDLVRIHHMSFVAAVVVHKSTTKRVLLIIDIKIYFPIMPDLTRWSSVSPALGFGLKNWQVATCLLHQFLVLVFPSISLVHNEMDCSSWGAPMESAKTLVFICALWKQKNFCVVCRLSWP